MMFNLLIFCLLIFSIPAAYGQEARLLLRTGGGIFITSESGYLWQGLGRFTYQTPFAGQQFNLSTELNPQYLGFNKPWTQHRYKLRLQIQSTAGYRHQTVIEGHRQFYTTTDLHLRYEYWLMSHFFNWNGAPRYFVRLYLQNAQSRPFRGYQQLEGGYFFSWQRGQTGGSFLAGPGQFEINLPDSGKNSGYLMQVEGHWQWQHEFILQSNLHGRWFYSSTFASHQFSLEGYLLLTWPLNRKTTMLAYLQGRKFFAGGEPVPFFLSPEPLETENQIYLRLSYDIGPDWEVYGQTGLSRQKVTGWPEQQNYLEVLAGMSWRFRIE